MFAKEQVLHAGYVYNMNVFAISRLNQLILRYPSLSMFIVIWVLLYKFMYFHSHYEEFSTNEHLHKGVHTDMHR